MRLTSSINPETGTNPVLYTYDADSEVTAMRASGLSVVASLALVGAALFLEYSCRVPRPPDDRDR